MAHLRFDKSRRGVVAGTSDALLYSHGILIDFDYEGRLYGIEFFGHHRVPVGLATHGAPQGATPEKGGGAAA